MILFKLYCTFFFLCFYFFRIINNLQIRNAEAPLQPLYRATPAQADPGTRCPQHCVQFVYFVSMEIQYNVHIRKLSGYMNIDTFLEHSYLNTSQC